MKNTLITIAIVFGLLLFFSQFSTRNNTVANNQLSEQGNTSSVSNTNKEEKPSLIISIIVSWWWYILYYSFAIMLGVFVYRDAKSNDNLALNIKPFWWGVVTALEPPLGLLAYWLIHYSKLNTVNTKNNENT